MLGIYKTRLPVSTNPAPFPQAEEEMHDRMRAYEVARGAALTANDAADALLRERSSRYSTAEAANARRLLDAAAAAHEVRVYKHVFWGRWRGGGLQNAHGVAANARRLLDVAAAAHEVGEEGTYMGHNRLQDAAGAAHEVHERECVCAMTSLRDRNKATVNVTPWP